jgi:hypothetical protein
MDLFGLSDAQNVPVAVVHYTAPTLILLYFIFASSVPATATSSSATGAAGGTGAGSANAARTRRQQEPSQVMKWIFVFAVLTFVSSTFEMKLIRRLRTELLSL